MNYQARLKKIQETLAALNCAAILVEEPTNLYYMTGCELSAGFLLITQLNASLIVDQRYFELCTKRSPFPVLPMETTSLDKLVAEFPSLGFDSENTSFKRYQDLEKTVKRPLIPLENPIKNLRMIKDSEELALLREAAQLGSLGFDFVCTLIQEGITEKEIAQELEIYWKKRGSKGVAFEPIIAFGAQGSMPHYRAGNVQLTKGMSILVDIGVNKEHYHSDMTRMIFFGAPAPQIREIHAIVERAQQAALALCKPGTLIGDLDAAARDLITSAGYGPQFSHSLGHGVGLEIHEAPTLRNKPPFNVIPLQAGMVITIEPGIYLSGIGGVRIEDTVAITNKGHENLSLRPTNPFFIKI